MNIAARRPPVAAQCPNEMRNGPWQAIEESKVQPDCQSTSQSAHHEARLGAHDAGGEDGMGAALQARHYRLASL